MNGTIVIEQNFIFFLLLVSPFIFFIFKYLRSQTLPPGPFPWPIIGSILHVGDNPHVSLAKLAQTHGPIISLRLGAQLLVVGSTPAAAAEILKAHDRVLSGRAMPNASPYKNPAGRQFSLAWADCTDQRKYLHTICRSELFSIKAIESQSNLREEKISKLIEFLGRKEGELVNIGDVVFATVFNTLSNIFVSQDFITLEGHKDGDGMKELVRSFVVAGATPNLADFYPILSSFDLQGLRKKSIGLFAKICSLWESIIKERRQDKSSGVLKRHTDFLDILLANGFTDDQMNVLLLELLLAGADTTTSTTEWAMAELLKNEKVMKNVCKEFEREIKEDVVRESDLPHLPYLHSCVKEALRIHPPAPFLLPRRAIETCKVMNYTIPKDSQVFVNVWAIGRDPKIWDDPLAFKPERFLDSKVELHSNDFGWIPFGSGRRMCPGIPMATKQLGFVLASLIKSFDWSLPYDMNPSELDMAEKFGITLQKEKPLVLIPRVKQ
uniref:Cytochrome P450 n=1 Tax=Sinopodophyllum hexandrum TaxID=93608 RepID=A0A0N9HM28_SINHE|nr:cytochrome P450 [Sinopodophyllum hexandrum]